MLSRVSASTAFKAVGKMNIMNMKIVTNRSMHSACLKRTGNWSMKLIFDCNQPYSFLRASSVRYASDGDEYSPSILERIPDVPQIPPPPAEVLKYHENGELMFQSMGLGGWSPSGLIQSGLEYIHIGFDMPWWAVVVTGTLIARTALFPLLLDSLKSSAKVQHHLPVVQKFQAAIAEGRRSGDGYQVAMQMHLLQEYMKKNDVKLFKSIIPMLIQMPLFVSFFFALRSMANTPVESLKTGGLWWFTDMTIADPYYLLPILSTGTMFLTIHTGAEGLQMQNKVAFHFMRAMPIFIFPFTMNFPTIIFCYWLTTNIFSLCQGQLMKSAYFRNSVGLPLIQKQLQNAPANKKGFLGEMKEAWDNAKVMKQLKERDLANQKAFSKAGVGPPIKTFKYNPTLVAQNQDTRNQVVAKPRNV